MFCWECVITPEEDGAEVLTVLRNHRISSATVSRAKTRGEILLDGQEVTVRRRVKAGQKLTLSYSETPSTTIGAVKMNLHIVYEDEWLLVVDKPAGIPVHPSAGHREDTLANGVAYYMQGKSFVFRPITRLDRYTSGLVLIAKNAVAGAELCRQISKGEMEKTYFAITKGIPNPAKGEINLPIGRMPDSVIQRQVTEKGKTALTYYETISVKGDKALVKVNPVTGRTHQIRVHMAAIGCPLYNDFLYGQQETDGGFFLRCTTLAFTHPLNGERMKIEIPHNFSEI
jgi:23S rRNA pseudouridine1911/1915/1917 synthase